MILLALAVAAVVISNLNGTQAAKQAETDVPKNSSTAEARRLTAVATRSGVEVVATGQAQRTATATARENSRAATAEVKVALATKCETEAKKATNVVAVSHEDLGSHAVAVLVPSLEVDLFYVNPAIFGHAKNESNSAANAYNFLINECLPLAEESATESPHLKRVKQATDKASKLLEATVAPMVTATARAYATARAANANVRSRNITFKCERLRLAEAEASKFGSGLVYQHVANVMMLTQQAQVASVYFDSYDAKTALEQCP